MVRHHYKPPSAFPYEQLPMLVPHLPMPHPRPPTPHPPAPPPTPPSQTSALAVTKGQSTRPWLFSSERRAKLSKKPSSPKIEKTPSKKPSSPASEKKSPKKSSSPTSGSGASKKQSSPASEKKLLKKPSLSGSKMFKKRKFTIPLPFARRKRTLPDSDVEWLSVDRGPSEDVKSKDGNAKEGQKDGEGVTEEQMNFEQFLRAEREDEIQSKAKEEGEKSEASNELQPVEIAEGENGEQGETWRCDIFAISAQDFADAEKECEQLVIEAGGAIVTGVPYVGGFLYTLPANFSGTPPLETSDETLQGGHIRVIPNHPSQADHQQSKPSDNPSQADDELPVPPIATEAEMNETVAYFAAVIRAARTPVSPITTHTTHMLAGDESPVSPIQSTSSLPRVGELKAIPLPPFQLQQQPEDEADADADADADSFLDSFAPVEKEPEEKLWPRPKDPTEIARAQDWIQVKSAERKAKVQAEANQGLGIEVSQYAEYEGGLNDVGGLYMDGFSDLAVWMSAGGPMGRDESVPKSKGKEKVKDEVKDETNGEEKIEEDNEV